jgi:Zn-dependent protease/CBS domain-containing protein
MNNDRAWALARIAGIEIRVHWSWVPGLALITVFVGLAPYGPIVDGDGYLRFGVGGAIAVLVLVSLGIHELTHSLVARRRGLAVGAITLGAMGGATRMDDEPRTADDELAISASGPIVSVMLGIALFALSVPLQGVSLDLAFIPAMVGGANVLLGLFNLVPALPLDGGRVLHAVAWKLTGDAARSGRVTGRIGRWVGGVALGLGLLLSLFGDALTGIVLVAGGWLLIQGSRIVDRRARIEELLAGVSVAEAMERDVSGISPSLTVDTFAEQLLADGERTTVPVVEGGSLLGLVGIGQLRRIARRRWSQLRASDVMVAPPALPRLAAEDGLWAGMELLRRSGLDGVPVMAGPALLGILTRRGVVTAIQARVAATEGGPAA